MKPEHLVPMSPSGFDGTRSLKLMAARIGTVELPHYRLDTVENANEMAKHLIVTGGFAQQDRMIRDKRHSLDQATKYSYQAALVRKVTASSIEEDSLKIPVRALINPDKLKKDYDDKIISIGFEHNFNSGDVFEWCNTNSYWLIYLQDLEELAYFRGEIRRCSYIINWKDEDGNIQSTYAAIRGPVETKINYLQKHSISIDTPNYSLNILMPKNKYTLNYFKRYSKFYLGTADDPDNKICWRVEATDSISTPGILEVVAVEYYANETEDDIDSGIVGAFEEIPQDPNNIEDTEIFFIAGETFIKPKKEYIYTIRTSLKKGHWEVEKKYPVELVEFEDENGFASVKVRWYSTYSGQFDLTFGDKYSKTIVVESLF